MSTAVEAKRPEPEPILVATDFSADAERAVARASLLAAATGRTIVLLAVVPPEALLPSWLDGSVPGLGDEERLASEVGARLAETAARHRIRSFRAAVRFGKPWAVILEEAQRERAALIVIGARGERGAQGRIGSTAWRVLQGTRRPLLIVRRPVQGAYARVLVAIDFDEAAGSVLATALAVGGEARVVVMHALGRPRLSLLTHGGASLDPLDAEPTTLLAEARSRLAALVGDRGAGRAIDLEVALGDPVEAVSGLIAAGSELVVFGAPRRHPWVGALLGSFALAQVASGEADLLIVPPDQSGSG